MKERQDCKCDHEHEHDHKHECGCDKKHEHKEKCTCEHEHKHSHENDHSHEHEECACGCGHDHGHSSGISLRNTVLKYVLGAIPIILSFIPMIPLPIRVVLSIIGYILFGYEVYVGMIKGFRRKKIFTEFTLMCAASLGAFFIGEFADAAAVVYLYSLGETLSDRAYDRSKDRIGDLLKIIPEFARVERNGTAQIVDPKDVALGESVTVLSGERVPIDGVVVSGGAYADTSSVTGESKALELYEGIECPSGAILTSGSVRIKTLRSYDNSIVARLYRSVKEAGQRKARAEKKISRFASVFTPIAFGVAILISLLGGIVSGDFIPWIKVGLVILVVSCPCSLVLSVPLTYFAALGYAASEGIIFRGGETIDAVGKIKAVAFDKTGTITESRLNFDKATTYGGFDENELIEISASALKYSIHPAAASFCETFTDSGRFVIKDVNNVPGRGMTCTANGKSIALGNAIFMRERKIEISDSKTTAIFVSLCDKLIGKLEFSSHIKKESLDIISRLKALKITNVALISGDAEESVRSTAKQVGIDKYYWGVAPDEKTKIMLELKNSSLDKKEKIAYCGDGLNDSSVIATADVGVAMGANGAALTVDSADVVIMDDDIRKLCRAIEISRRTGRIATQNIIISLGIKIVVMAMGIVISALGGSVPMELAIVADVGAALVAVANALRASKGGIKNGKRKKQ